MILHTCVETNILLWQSICQAVYDELVTKDSTPFDRVSLFAALADPTRLRLLNLMSGREVCVCYFVEILRQPQPKISRHLAYLRRAGIVNARREGKWMHYRIERPHSPAARSVLEATLESFRDDPEMQADLARLANACCEPQRFVALTGAPVPAHIARTSSVDL